nr:beta-galactosidase-like isoform X1 [Dermacentor andersoni]
MAAPTTYVLLALAFLARTVMSNKTSRSFVIDYTNNQYLKDGKPIQIVAGAIHYFRNLHQQWGDRLATMRTAGLNAIQTYVEWSSHEPEEGHFDFEGQQDLVRFLKLAQDHGFLVLLRIGPYICAERDMGGLPYWLLSRNSSIGLRTSDKQYLGAVEKYFSKLLPMLHPLLYANGGPIIAVQVENEYGSYGACDFSYTAWLRDLVRLHLGYNVILYTADGPADDLLMCGKIDGAHATINFGVEADVEDAFKAQRRHQERGPLVDSEFYTGWLDHWAEWHSMTNTSDVVRQLNKTLSMNASVVMYMFHGGTSFGYKSGANTDNGRFLPCPTSYDYDAPMTEAGDPTEKFVAIRNIISKYLPVPTTSVPKPKQKMALGKIWLKKLYGLADIRRLFANATISSKLPLSFEQLRQSQAVVLYDTEVKFRPRNPAVLSVPGLRDRGYVYVNDVYRGLISRMDDVYDVMIPVKEGQRLTVVVESQGRIGYGFLNDTKGIISNVTLSGVNLTDWQMTSIDERGHLDRNHLPIESAHSSKANMPTGCIGASTNGLAIYEASFPLRVSPPRDTFIRLDHWKKGAVFLNGFNLGRYWTPMGPQQTLYVPAVLFKTHNVLHVMELEKAPCGIGSRGCFVKFVDTPDINGTVPYS